MSLLDDLNNHHGTFTSALDRLTALEDKIKSAVAGEVAAVEAALAPVLADMGTLGEAIHAKIDEIEQAVSPPAAQDPPA